MCIQSVLNVFLRLKGRTQIYVNNCTHERHIIIEKLTDVSNHVSRTDYVQEYNVMKSLLAYLL